MNIHSYKTISFQKRFSSEIFNELKSRARRFNHHKLFALCAVCCVCVLFEVLDCSILLFYFVILSDNLPFFSTGFVMLYFLFNAILFVLESGMSVLALYPKKQHTHKLTDIQKDIQYF